jgi:hypothetical protein
MQDQRSGADMALADDEVERTVLALLLESKAQGQWSVDELAREVGGEVETADAIVRLHAAGLVHRCNEFVWLTRPAMRFHQLAVAA